MGYVCGMHCAHIHAQPKPFWGVPVDYRFGIEPLLDRQISYSPQNLNASVATRHQTILNGTYILIASILLMAKQYSGNPKNICRSFGLTMLLICLSTVEKIVGIGKLSVPFSAATYVEKIVRIGRQSESVSGPVSAAFPRSPYDESRYDRP